MRTKEFVDKNNNEEEVCDDLNFFFGIVVVPFISGKLIKRQTSKAFFSANEDVELLISSGIRNQDSGGAQTRCQDR